MKSTLKLILTIIAVAAIVVAGCKKGGSTASNTTKSNIDAVTAAKRIGIAFYKSFTGQYGGANAVSGKTPAGNNVSSRVRVNSLMKPYCGCTAVQPYCGYTIDTTDNFTYHVGDTTKNVDSKYKFIYTCSNNVLDGYFLTDSVTYTDHGTLFTNKYLIAQNYIVTSAAADYSLVNMHGYMGNNFVEKILDAGGAIINTKTNNTQYSFNDVKIKTNGEGIISGTVNFTAVLSEVTANGTINGSFTGTMTFLGNYKATISVTYQGHTDSFTIDLVSFETAPVCGCATHG